MRSLIPLVAAFGFGASIVAIVALAVMKLPGLLMQRRIETRLRLDLSGAGDDETPTVIKQADEGPLPAIDRMLARGRHGSALARLLQQAGMKTSPSALLLVAVLSAVGVGLAAAVTLRTWWAPFAGAAVGMVLPFSIVNRRRRQRLHRFEEKFPDALDLLSRAIRAGHAFTTAMGMVADESGDPIGPEFRKTFDEQNFGLPLADALANLSGRVPLLDVRFFATAVLIQRETGGNLSEILDNLAHVVRERFKVIRQVRVYTAHGRFTGWVLMALPAALCVILSIINPDHMMVLFRERMGQMMLGIAVLMQLSGFIWIKRIVKIEV